MLPVALLPHGLCLFKRLRSVNTAPTHTPRSFLSKHGVILEVTRPNTVDAKRRTPQKQTTTKQGKRTDRSSNTQCRLPKCESTAAHWPRFPVHEHKGRGFNSVHRSNRDTGDGFHKTFTHRKSDGINNTSHGIVKELKQETLPRNNTHILCLRRHDVLFALRELLKNTYAFFTVIWKILLCARGIMWRPPQKCAVKEVSDIILVTS